jgi:glycine/D-amino acid oxidase-like deaminating enzyme
MPLYRPFGSIAEQNSWMARSATPGMEKFIEHISATPLYGHQINDPFGGILLRQCGYVNVNALMEAIRGKFQEEGYYRNEFFAQEALVIQPMVQYGEFEAARLIFCEGTGVRTNPFFKWLPVNSLKGETLEVTLSGTLELIYNRGVYLVPWEKGGYKVGATYQRNAEAGITAEGRAELVQKLDDLIQMPYEIIKQDWGYRPTIIDRRPVLGAHPEFPNLMVFNGLGTKGVSLAPHFSGVLTDHILYPSQIEKEVNISRFYTLYSKF